MMGRRSRYSSASLGFLLLIMLAACSGGGGGAPPVQPTSTASASASPTSTPLVYPSEAAFQSDVFVDSIGAVTHFDYTSTPYVTAFPAVESALVSSGIRHIRDGSDSYADYGTRLTQIGAAGINHSIQVGAVTDSAMEIASAVAAQVPYVDFVEPVNEYDLNESTDPTWASELVASQQLLYTTIRSLPQYSAIPVLGPSLSNIGNYAQLGDLDAISDAGNLHDFTCNLNPGTSSDLGIATQTSNVRLSTSKPIWTTEIGYNDDMTRPCSIPDAIIAKYDPRTVAERFMAGEPRIYFYQFTDDPTDPIFGGMGLTDQTGAPKVQYTAMASMISLLNDRGPAFTTSPLAFSLSGSTKNVSQMLLQKRDGSYILMLWLELPDWQSVNASNIGGTPITVSPQTVIVKTAQSHATATEYQYTSTWGLAPTSLPTNTNSYTLSIGDSITFLVLK